MERDAPQRLLECFEAIDRKGGRALSMDFYRVGGSKRNEKQLLLTMEACNLIAKKEENGNVYYEKTHYGNLLHVLLKNRGDVGPLFEVLGQTRLRLDSRWLRLLNEKDKNSATRYFAYGSNMNPERMKSRGIAFSERTAAILKNYSLKFNKKATGQNAKPGEGKGNIVPDPGSQVEGVLYNISLQGLHDLDSNEGYPTHYDRVELPVGQSGRDILSNAYSRFLENISTLD